MKKIVSLVVPFLCVGALHAMDKQAKRQYETLDEKFKKGLRKFFDKGELLTDFERLAEDNYGKVNDPIAVIKEKLTNYEKQYGPDEKLKEEVLNFPEKFQDELEYAQNTRIITAGLGVVCAVVAGTSVWLGFSQYTKGQTLIGTCFKRGGCTVIGVLSSLWTLVASDQIFYGVARAQNRVNRYAKYQNQVATLFE